MRTSREAACLRPTMKCYRTLPPGRTMKLRLDVTGIYHMFYVAIKFRWLNIKLLPIFFLEFRLGSVLVSGKERRMVINSVLMRNYRGIYNSNPTHGITLLVDQNWVEVIQPSLAYKLMFSDMSYFSFIHHHTN